MNKNYYTEFINFFKRHGLYNKEIFKYIETNTEKFDYYNEDMMNIRGIYYNYDKQNNLVDFKLYLPFINNEITAFINIRPYIKAIYAYPKLGKKYKENAASEMIVLYFERLYLKENPSKEIETYLNNIYKSINEEKEQSKYKIALNAQSELEEFSQISNPSFQNLQKKAKKLFRKHLHR